MLLFVCLESACSDDKKEGLNGAVLEVEAQTVDFKEDGSSQTIVVTTNQKEWSATVESSGKNWCTLLPDIQTNNHRLNISVTPNNGKAQRTTSVIVKAAELSKKIEVRQLGSDRGILLSPMMKNFTSEGGRIDFTITANVEFEITLMEEWITLPVTARSAEYVTTEHSYFIQRNNGEKRTGSIVVKDKESDLYAELVIDQDAFSEYEGPESSIKDDVLVPVSGGTAVNRLGEKSQYSTSVFSRAYDGDKVTGYHSGDKKSDNEDKWPLRFTFEFAEQSSIDYLVCHSASADKMKKAHIYVSTKEKPQYELLMENVEFAGSASRITFPASLIEPLGIRIEALETSGDYVVIKEMEFYRKNAENYDPLELFTDITCTELKVNITEKEINACPDPLFRNMAYYMFVDKYPRDFRIRDCRAYPYPELFRQANKTSAIHNLLDNPTGIFVKKGEEVVVLIGDTHGTSLSARILNLNVPGKDGFNDNYSYSLAAGMNRFIAETDGLIYIYYHTPDYQTAEPIKVHIPSGRVNGYFDSRIHQPSDWNRLLNATVGPHFDVLGKYAHLIFPVDKFKTNTPDGKALIDAYDRLVLLEQQFMGLEKYDRMDPNRVCFSVMYNDAYMYSSSAHTGYVVSTMNALCNVDRLMTSDIWGPAHEVGHSYQTKPGLCWHGMVEVTNNIFALYVQTTFGNQSRLLTPTSDKKYTSICEKSMALYFSKRRPHNELRKDDEASVFERLVPFWQLHLYTQAIGNPDLYKDLYERVRTEPNQTIPGASQVEFAVFASEAARLDLTEFFEVWGFFEPIDVTIDDYGEKKFIVTKEMGEMAKQRIKELNLPKPSMKVQYISDNNVGCYENNKSITKGSARKNGNEFIMSGWNGVAVYEVFSDNQCIFVSPSSSFTVAGTLGQKVEVYAVSASGNKEQVKY